MSRSVVSLILVVAAVAGCDDETVEPLGPFTLTFQGDASFQGAHAGQEMAAVLDADGAVVGEAMGTVSDTEDPSFSFEFTRLVAGDYNVQSPTQTTRASPSTFRACRWAPNTGGGMPPASAPPPSPHPPHRTWAKVEASLRDRLGLL